MTNSCQPDRLNFPYYDYFLVNKKNTYRKNNTGCFKIGEFRIQSVVGKDPVKLEKYLEKKNRPCI
jgi:hypothetical protein